MSRYQGWARFPDRHRVLVGWDESRCTFWFQIIDQAAWRRNADRESEIGRYMAGESEWHWLIDELEEVVLDQCGAAARELPSIAALVHALKPYGGLETGQVRLLIHDRQLSRCPGATVGPLGWALLAWVALRRRVFGWPP